MTSVVMRPRKTGQFTKEQNFTFSVLCYVARKFLSGFQHQCRVPFASFALMKNIRPIQSSLKLNDMKENTLNKKVMLTISDELPQCVLFRNNTGTGYNGRKVFNGRNVTIYDYRVIHAGLTTGGSDLIGWTMVKITPEMVGQNIAVFTAMEDKTTGQRATDKQKNFIKRIQMAGGIAGIVRSASDAVKLIKDFMI